MSFDTAGRFFEDYAVDDEIAHATPRTVGEGERALYFSLYPSRHALASSAEFAKACGFERGPLDDLIAFHTVFGKTVPDISLNAVANLGYGEGRFLAPVFAGDTLSASSQVIGLKQNSNGKSGIVWVRTTGRNQHGDAVLSYCRWVMVRKRDVDAPAPDPVVPKLAEAVDPATMDIGALDYSRYDFAAAGSSQRFGDYATGDFFDHVDGVTLTDAEHMMATRLWQNAAKVHFNTQTRSDGKRLIYGGHIISLARALSFNGLANAQTILAINAGSHANPSFAGDTIYAGTRVLDKSPTKNPSVGALRVQLIAAKTPVNSAQIKGEDGKYLPHVVLDLDLWVSVPV